MNEAGGNDKNETTGKREPRPIILFNQAGLLYTHTVPEYIRIVCNLPSPNHPDAVAGIQKNCGK